MARKKGSGNAFERAVDAALAFQISWWRTFEEGIAENNLNAAISNPALLQLGNEDSAFGPRIFERRTVTISQTGGTDVSWTITRPIPMRFGALPLEMLEDIARDILSQTETAWRRANIDNLIAEAQTFDHDEALELAREILGADASPEDLDQLAEQMRLPDILAQGGEAAEKFFDEQVSLVQIGTVEDGSPEILPDPLPPPGNHPFDISEWDFYTIEEIDHLGGPEHDAAYAFRVVRLCEEIRVHPEDAVQLAMQLGGITREWELWRENEEFLKMGRARFAAQTRLAKSKPEKPWMTQVRGDFETGAIGSNIADYARKLARRRDLHPPSIERIRNFISDLKHRNSRPDPDDASR